MKISSRGATIPLEHDQLQAENCKIQREDDAIEDNESVIDIINPNDIENICLGARKKILHVLTVIGKK